MDHLSVEQRSGRTHGIFLPNAVRANWLKLFFMVALVMAVIGFGSMPERVFAVTCEPLEAALTGNAESQNLLGLAYIDGKKGCIQDSEKGIRWLKKAAANGSRNAIDNLCWAYGGGYMPDKNGKMIANPLLPIRKKEEAIWCGKAGPDL
ncbi:MAG: hypothetical protein ACYDAM_08785 [Leptospirales bacterium]